MERRMEKPGTRTADRQTRLALARLTERQQECLALLLYDGLSHGRIAREFGIDRTVVRRHVQRGLERLSKAGLTPRPVTMAPPSMTYMNNETLDRISPDGVVAVW